MVGVLQAMDSVMIFQVGSDCLSSTFSYVVSITSCSYMDDTLILRFVSLYMSQAQAFVQTILDFASTRVA
jgi:hypothetical protein